MRVGLLLKFLIISCMPLASATRNRNQKTKSPTEVVSASQSSTANSAPTRECAAAVCFQILNETAEAETRLNKFVGRLMSFLVDDGFDRVGFSMDSDNLSKEISSLRQKVGMLPYSPKLTQHLAFAKRVFREMMNANKSLDFYSLAGPDQQLVRSITSLNLRLFKLYNSEGNPDSGMKNYASKVARFKSVLNIWRGIFDDLEVVPFNVWIFFENQLSEVNKSIEVLERHIKR
ncbi:hypothetical protein JCM33374_g3988 [Metschnikowia sp. JCM 33374]|nr:hypothetical protein JCM33374_g3988 [Metschnikowia sp. JCM 33374]